MRIRIFLLWRGSQLTRSKALINRSGFSAGHFDPLTVTVVHNLYLRHGSHVVSSADSEITVSLCPS